MKSKKNQFKYLTITMVAMLSIVFLMYSCKKSSASVTPPTTTTLSAAIDSAKWYLANTSEGTQSGEYAKGSQATLQTALTAAEGVLASTSSTQAEVTAAAANLNAAIMAYENGLITPIAAASLVAYWKFNGNANDSSGNGHNGTLEACPPTVGGVGLIQTAGVTPGPVPNLTMDRFNRANSAYHFSNGGNIDVPFSPALNPSAISISLWERQDTAGRVDGASNCYMIALDRWNGWKFQMQPTRPFFTYRYIGGGDTSYVNQDAGVAAVIGTTTGAGPWHHLVTTYDGNGNLSFYIDGVLTKTWANQGAYPINPINPSADLSIGTDLPNSAYSYSSTAANYIAYGGYWTGDLDDIMIYNVALTASQVTQIYNQQVTQ